MHVLRWLLVFLPVAVGAHFLHAPPLVVFTLSALAIVPLSGLLGEATEELATHTSAAVGGLLNATLGNLAELIIGALALRAGLVDLVKASITGSILGNLLLVLGAAQLAGGLKFQSQRFSPQLVGVSLSLLTVAVIGLAVPALFHAAHPDPARIATVHMSAWVAGFLVLGYVLSLVFSFRRGDQTAPELALEEARAGATTGGPLWRAVTLLILSALAIAYLSELLVGAVEGAVEGLGLSSFFVGLIVVPIIGNAAEHSSAILMARRDRMDLAITIAVGSTIQVALLIAPSLVFLGLAFGRPMDLAFRTMEVVSIGLAVGIAATVVRDAESNWLEGAFLLIVYAILASAFFFY